jgi:hypothetical protein
VRLQGEWSETKWYQGKEADWEENERRKGEKAKKEKKEEGNMVIMKKKAINIFIYYCENFHI